MRARPILKTAFATAATVIAVAGCGSDDPSSSNSLASGIPDDAGIVFQANLHPSDDQTAAIESMASRVAGVDDLGELIQTQLDTAFSEAEPPLDYSDQIEPWVGDRMVVWATASDLTQEADSYAILLETTDPGQAEDLFEDIATETGEYDGVTYYLGDDDTTRVAVVDDLVVGGTPESFEHAVDTLHGGPTLDDSELDERLEGDSLGSMWLDLEAAISASPDTDQETLDAIGTIAPDFLAHPLTASLDVSDSTVDLDLTMGSVGAISSSSRESTVLTEVPADSVYAAGNADLGDTYASLIELGTQLEGEPGAQYQQLQDQAEFVTGVPLDETLAALGDSALFARGDSQSTIEAGFLVEVRDTDTFSKALDGAIKAAEQSGLPMEPPPTGLDADAGFTIPSGGTGGFPVPITVALRGDRFAIASTSAIEELFDPVETLDAATYYDEARESLGDTPLGVYSDLAALGTLLRSFVSQAPELGPAAVYLEKFTFATAGVTTDDDQTDVRVVVGVGD